MFNNSISIDQKNYAKERERNEEFPLRGEKNNTPSRELSTHLLSLCALRFSLSVTACASIETCWITTQPSNATKGASHPHRTIAPRSQVLSLSFSLFYFYRSGRRRGEGRSSQPHCARPRVVS